jgi:hypothetical protein
VIPYATYKLIHLLGVLLVFLSLGGRVQQAAAAGGVTGRGSATRLVSVTHGLGLFLVLLGGFGLMARLGITHGLSWPGWIWVKVGVWVTLGAALALPLRFPALARPLWLILPLLGATAVYMAVFKPF